jgi:hypothetical protein
VAVADWDQHGRIDAPLGLHSVGKVHRLLTTRRRVAAAAP